MNDLSNALRDEELLNNNRHCCLPLKPIPAQALFVLVPLLFIGLSASIFIWVVVRSFVFFVSVFFVSALVLLFIVWNVINWRRKGAVLIFLDSFPDSDLRVAKDGQLVKVTGYVKEGSPVTVVGLLRRNNDVFMIVEPPELISTGCLWQKLLLPVEIDGLILRVPKTSSSAAVTATH